MTCLGLLGLGTVLFITQNNRAQEQAVSANTPPPEIPTAAPTDTPLPPLPTDTPTPLPTPTGTLVVSNVEGGQEAADTEEGFTIEDFLPQATSTSDPEDATPTSTLVIRDEVETPVSDSEALALAEPPEEMPPGGGVLQAEKSNPLVWAGIILLIALIIGVIVRRKSAA